MVWLYQVQKSDGSNWSKCETQFKKEQANVLKEGLKREKEDKHCSCLEKNRSHSVECISGLVNYFITIFLSTSSSYQSCRCSTASTHEETNIL